MYLSRQLYEEALHVQFYLTLLDTYVPDPEERAARRSPRSRTSRRSGARPSSACAGWTRSHGAASGSRRASDRRTFLLNLICFAACIEGLFFFGAFAYVYFLRSRGPAARAGRRARTGCSATRARTWRSRSRSSRTVRARGARAVRRASSSATCATMLDEAVDCETQFAEDLLARRRRRPVGRATCAQYLEFCADQRLATLGPAARATARRTRSRSWTCRTCRRSRTSSSAASRRTRSASPAKWPRRRVLTQRVVARLVSHRQGACPVF